jgi:cation transport protein ChaC
VFVDTSQFGVAYKLAGSPEHQRETLRYLEWREKQYDHREYVDVYASAEDNEAVLEGALCYIATENKESNPNFLGPAPMDEIAAQIARAEGPSGPNWEYLFKLAESLEHVRETDEDLFHLKETVQVIMEAENCTE